MPEKEEEKNQGKKEEPPCDPLVEDCSVISGDVKKLTRERAFIQEGIADLKRAGDIFEDNRFKPLIEDAEKLLQKYDAQIKDGFKKFNVCDTKKEEPLKKEETTVKPPLEK